MFTTECPRCGHQWRWLLCERDLVHRTRQTDDGWRTLAVVLFPDHRPDTGWMTEGLIWRRAVHVGKVLGVYWLRFDVAGKTGEELSEIMYQRTGFLTTEKREELGLDGDQTSRS